MTVSYQYDVASSTSGGFTRLLFKWQGSLYKLIYNELILFCCSYALVAAIYRYVFNQHQKRVFEQVAFYCDTYMNYIPLSFILGFYVSFVASRWWQQYMAIPWPDKILHAIALYVGGNDEKSRILRRSLVRYLNLSLVMVLRSISSAVKKRFPTLDHLVEAGFISSEELSIFNQTPNKEFNTYWIPCTWFTALVKEARIQKKITDPVGLKLIMEEFCEFRQKCGMLWSYDWVSIPLVYTQVVTIATYSFFIAAIVGRQFVEKSPIPYKKMIDLYVPFFTLLQFFFYMGLLKVAEQLINPFGDDDEDFELNWIIDRHMKVSYLIVDTLIARAPPLTKDIFFNEESPELPYTEASASFKKKTYRGSVANMVIPEEQQNLILPDIIEEGEESDDDLKYLKTHLKQSHLSLRFSDMHSHSNSSEAPQDGRSLSVPEMHYHPLSSSRGNSFRSTSHSKPQSRRIGTAGSKGVSSALIVVGSNQAVMGADSTNAEKGHSEIEEDDGGTPLKKDSLQSQLDDEDYLFYPFRDVCLNIEDNNFDSSTDSYRKFKERSSSWIPASIQAKIAMKKKPVIKWRPYHKPLQIPEAYISQESLPLEDIVPPGVFEEECAFMWRTIDEETNSSSNLAICEDSKVLVPSPAIDRKILSYYSETKLRSSSRDAEDTLIASNVNLTNSTNISSCKTTKAKRSRYKFKGRTKQKLTKNRFNSMPYLPNLKCGQNAIISRLLKSLSESSVFMETVTHKIEDLHESHLYRSRNTDYRIPSIPKKKRAPLSVRQRSTNEHRPNSLNKTS